MRAWGRGYIPCASLILTTSWAKNNQILFTSSKCQIKSSTAYTAHNDSQVTTYATTPWWCDELGLSRAHTPRAMAPISSSVGYLHVAWSVVSSMQRCRYRLYYSTTLTYFEIEHAQWKQHMALIGVVDRHGQWKRTIYSARGPFWAIQKVVFRDFDCLVA